MMKSLENFLDSVDENHQAYGAFQIIVLARVIVDVDQVNKYEILPFCGEVYKKNQNNDTLERKVLVDIRCSSMFNSFLTQKQFTSGC